MVEAIGLLADSHSLICCEQAVSLSLPLSALHRLRQALLNPAAELLEQQLGKRLAHDLLICAQHSI